MCYRCNKKKPNTQIEDMKTNNTVKVWRLEFGKRVEKAVNEGFFEEKLKSKGWQRVEEPEKVEPTETTETTEAPKKSRKKKEVENEAE